MRLVPVCLAAALLSGCAGTPDVALHSAAPDPQRAVVEGSRVLATARVVAVPGRPVRLCGDAPVAAVGYLPGREPAPAYCAAGVDVEGVDLGALSQRRSKDGASEGFGRFEGVWRDGVVHVDVQQPAPPAFTAAPPPPDVVPCPAPDRGWPVEGPGSNLLEDEQASLQRYTAAHPQQLSWLALRRPAAGRLTLVLGVHDDAERADAERLLRPALGARLCLPTVRTAAADLAAVEADPALRAGPGQVFSSGRGVSPAGEVTHSVGVTLVTPELRAAADRHPAGMVVFEPTVMAVR